MKLSAPFLLPKPARPQSRLLPPLRRPKAFWPAISIVILLCLSVIMPPIVLTVMNGVLVCLVLLVVLSTNRRIDPALLWMGVGFLFMTVIGLISGVANDRYLYLKDAWYVGNPFLVICIGYILYVNKPDITVGLRAFVIGGLIVSLWQLRPYFMDPEIILLPAETIRRAIGAGHYAPIVAVIILFMFAGRWREQLRLPAWIAAPILAVACAAVIGVFSRTALLVVVVAGIAWLGCFAKREWLRLLLPMIGLGAIAFSMQLLVDVNSDQSLRTFAGKLARTVHEVTVSDYGGVRDINLNFRGHETARAFAQYADGSFLELLVGRGFGALVDLGVYLPLEFNEARERINVRYISTLHNGYAFILTKTGALGTAIFLAILFQIYLKGRVFADLPISNAASIHGRLLQASAVIFATTTYVVAGMFNRQDMFPFLLLVGYLFAHFSRGSASSEVKSYQEDSSTRAVAESSK